MAEEAMVLISNMATSAGQLYYVAVDVRGVRIMELHLSFTIWFIDDMGRQGKRF